MANYNNIDRKSDAGKRGFRFGTRGNRLVYVHCGKPARIIQKLMPDGKCQEFVACATCLTEARIASGCERGIVHSHFGFDLTGGRPGNKS